jgi:hypothetical protein
MEKPLTISEQITAAEALIADLETRRQTAAEAGEQAREARASVALAAAEGDEAALAELEQATAAATKAVLAIENVDLALTGARERLAGLQAQAAQERLATARVRALELARERQRLGPQLQQALTDLSALFVGWHDAGYELAQLRYEHQSLYLPHGTDQDRAFLSAIPDDLRQTFRKLTSWVHPTDRRPIAEADPAAAILRSVGELAPLPPEPPSLAEQVLDELNAEAARSRRTDNPHIALETGRPLVDGDVHPAHAAQDAMLAGFRVVGRTASGGAITERVRDLNPPPAAPPEPAEAA